MTRHWISATQSECRCENRKILQASRRLRSSSSTPARQFLWPSYPPPPPPPSHLPLQTGPRLILNQPFFVSSRNAELSTHQLVELEILLGKSNGSQGMGGEKPHLPVIVDMPKVLNFFAESPCNAERAEIFTNLTETPAMQANQSDAHLTSELLVNPTVLSGWKRQAISNYTRSIR